MKTSDDALLVPEAVFFSRVAAKAASRQSDPDSILHSVQTLSMIVANSWDSIHDFETGKDRPHAVSPYENESQIFCHSGHALFFELKDARRFLFDESLMRNWLYDRKTGLVVLNVFPGYHTNMTSHLYQIYTGKSDVGVFDYNAKFSEAYVIEGFGMFLSSVSSRPLIGENVSLNAQEKKIFSGINFRRFQ